MGAILQEEAESDMMKLFFSSLRPLTFLSLFIFSLVPETVQSSGCGLKKSPMRGQNRIINGQEAKVNEWPWMVSLRTSPTGNFCGGAVIGKRWIITAAHCLVISDASSKRPKRPKEVIRIYLGDHDLKDASETDKVGVYKVDSFKAHEKYDGRWNVNDIVVIKVSKSIDLSQHTPVCLPRRNRKFVGSKAMATGWGVKSYTYWDKPIYSDVLQEVSLTIRDSSFCGLWGYKLWRGQLCAGGSGGAGGSGVGTCYGDSGGPLTVEGRTGRHTLVGVTSFGKEDKCVAKKPSYFADVSYYRGWIKENTGI